MTDHDDVLGRQLRERLDAELGDLDATPEGRARLLAAARGRAPGEARRRPWWQGPRLLIPVATAAAVAAIVAVPAVLGGPPDGRPAPVQPGTGTGTAPTPLSRPGAELGLTLTADRTRPRTGQEVRLGVTGTLPPLRSVEVAWDLSERGTSSEGSGVALADGDCTTTPPAPLPPLTHVYDTTGDKRISVTLEPCDGSLPITLGRTITVRAAAPPTGPTAEPTGAPSAAPEPTITEGATEAPVPVPTTTF
jgi:hypothetical protein